MCKAYTQMEGVLTVGVSLAHEEALIKYNPAKIQEIELHDTLQNLGYRVRDANKLRSIGQEKEELRQSIYHLLAASIITFYVLIWMKNGF